MFDNFANWSPGLGLVALAALVLAGCLWHIRTLVQRVAVRDRHWKSLRDALLARTVLTPQLSTIAGLYIPWDAPLLTDLSDARREALAARGPVASSVAETGLSWALARLLVAIQGHEKLAEHADFAAIYELIVLAEQEVERARNAYNAEVVRLQQAVSHVSGMVLAPISGVTPGEPFELDPGLAREAMMASIDSGLATG